MDMQRMLDTAEVAEIMGVHPDTLLDRLAAGEFPPPFWPNSRPLRWAPGVIAAVLAGEWTPGQARLDGLRVAS